MTVVARASSWQGELFPTSEARALAERARAYPRRPNRRLSIRARVAIEIIRALERLGPMHHTALAAAVGRGRTDGTFHYARRELVDAEQLLYVDLRRVDSLGRGRTLRIYLLPAQCVVLTRYALATGRRLIYPVRGATGAVDVVDAPAGSGTSYVVERDVPLREVDALVADYVAESKRRGCPAATVASIESWTCLLGAAA